MPRRRLLRACLLLLATYPAAALALDYRSVGVARGILYDAPSASAKKLYVVSQYYPVEVIVDLGAWVKVRDKTGELAWIESRNLVPKRTVIALERIEVRDVADMSGRVLFRADKDVVLELVEPLVGGGWAKVRHRDGATGFVPASQVWGL
ncbi:MAG: SH3 domain-containing protein [Methylophilaceae bacterium]|nr:SH3 domain-containing protein [Methylophilaceae bacterium]